MNEKAARDRLIELQARVQRQVGGLRAEAFQQTGGEASGGLSNLPLHPADLASRQTEEDIAISLVSNEEGILNDIESALHRLQLGRYDVCEECGGKIGAERLEALPYARTCVKCASREG